MKSHEASKEHVSGTAEYVDDRPIHRNELYVEVLYSPVAKGQIQKIDVQKALDLPGVHGVFTHKDLKHNLWGSIFIDQPFLVEKQVNYVGEPIAIVAADRVDTAREAKNLIELEIQSEDAVLELSRAIREELFIGPRREIACGNIDASLNSAPHKISGVMELDGQDHFYLESQASVAYPKEGGQIEVHSSSQHPTEVQHLVAEALGIKHNQVVCLVKRMGGAFGGKESQAAPFAVFASLVAHKLNRPARVILTKDDDMKMTGKRNPFQCHYEVGFDEDGKILALDAKLYSDSGAYADLSTAIMERAMLHLDNAYNIPNFRVVGQVCKTNTHPSTAFRGFGGPKGIVTIESIVEEVASHLKLDAIKVRQSNVYQKGDETPYGQTIDDNVLPELFGALRDKSNYDARRKEVEKHNSESHPTLRGLSATAVKFGISFTTRFLNQGGALVNVHLDGTVQVSTGATEMGQGVNTKIAQVVSEELSIDSENVRVMTTSTEKIPNTSATAASSGSDINGQAATVATKKIKERLARVAEAVLGRPKELRGKPVAGAGTADEIDITKFRGDNVVFDSGQVYQKTNPDKKISFAELVNEAYLNRVSLSDSGYYRYPGIHFNKETGKGRPFFYFTNGVAASEVSVDKYTGEVKVLRTDLLMDLGRTINHGIDMGQVTGAFVQGLGWVTTEALYYKDGELLSCSPSTYKIPSVHDIPREFHCELFENDENERNLRGSKAVGEPPLMLAISAWTAIKDAISYKSSNKLRNVPATQERVFWALHGETEN